MHAPSTTTYGWGSAFMARARRRNVPRHGQARCKAGEGTALPLTHVEVVYPSITSPSSSALPLGERAESCARMPSISGLGLAVSALAAVASAHQAYVALLPNGANVPGAAAIGHVNPAGGGARNSFGIQFWAEWTNKCACGRRRRPQATHLRTRARERSAFRGHGCWKLTYTLLRLPPRRLERDVLLPRRGRRRPVERPRARRCVGECALEESRVLRAKAPPHSHATPHLTPATLTDPCCVWTHATTPAYTTDISHPGLASSTTSRVAPACAATACPKAQ